MQIGEEKKEENRSQDLSARLQAVQSPILRKSKGQSPSPVQNRNTWLSSTPSRSRSGSSASSEKLATTLTTKTSFIATTKAPSLSHTIQNTTLVQSTSTSNITSFETVLRMDQLDWNIVLRRKWSRMLWVRKGTGSWQR